MSLGLKSFVDIILGRSSNTPRGHVINAMYRQSLLDLDESREKLVSFQKDLEFLKAKVANSR